MSRVDPTGDETVVSARRPRLPVRPRREPVGPWGRYVNQVLVRKGLSYRRAYERINQAAQEGGDRFINYGRHSIRNWIGGVIPHADALRWIAAGLDEPIETVSAQAEAHRRWRYEQQVQTIATPQSAGMAAPFGAGVLPPAALDLSGASGPSLPRGIVPAAAAGTAAPGPAPAIPYDDELAVRASCAGGWLPGSSDLPTGSPSAAPPSGRGPGRRAAVWLPDAGAAGVWLITTGDGDDDVERRMLLKLIGGALALPLAGPLEDLRRRVDGALAPAATGHEVEEWERLADEYSRMVGYLPPGDHLTDLLTDLDEVRSRLTTATDDLHPRLLRVCGLLSALIAITLQTQIGDTGNAVRYWRTALRAVDQTGDRTLRSQLRGRRAVLATYDPRQSASVLALADDAITVADGMPCAGVASGYAARAQVFAQLGQHDQARDALRQLSDTFDRLPGSLRRWGQWGQTEQRLRFVESHVHSYAGRLSTAASAQDAALALYPPSSYQGRAQIELHRATCLIVAGDPSEGARHAICAIQALPSEHRHDALVRRTAALALDQVPEAARSLPAVAEARDLLAAPSGA
jgi:hypothetical protein